MAGNVPLLRLPLELQHEIYSYVIASQSSEFINERGYLSFPVALLHALGTNRPDFWRSNCIESEDCNTYRQWVRKCAVILDFSASTGDDHQADLIQKRRQVEKLVDLLKEFESLDTLTISLDSYIRHSWVSLGKREYNEGVDSPHRRRMNEREYQKLLRTTTIILEPLKQLRGIRNVQMNHNTDLLQDGELQDIVGA
ncbi:hypothetical protein EV356DRAFT_517960 [Viridothelium virens]|uniref:Uncharacterized protein n=1 Tax=Viridothelium virens TaxID=1048519 RepID=A0A6A6HLL3_VIRVR|nr:hypothetical protein EV356DRAFT_517960 [Viridothelium virens]